MTFLLYLLLSMLRCRWAATRCLASLNSRCSPSRSNDGFCSTNCVISISILLPSTCDLWNASTWILIFFSYLFPSFATFAQKYIHSSNIFISHRNLFSDVDKIITYFEWTKALCSTVILKDGIGCRTQERTSCFYKNLNFFLFFFSPEYSEYIRGCD